MLSLQLKNHLDNLEQGEAIGNVVELLSLNLQMDNMFGTIVRLITKSFFVLCLFISCNSDDEKAPDNSNTAQLIFKFKFDASQERLDNFGAPAVIPAGHAAQTPVFNLMGAHYIELSGASDIPAYNATQIVESPTTTKGGAEAIDFDQALYAADGETFYATEIKNIPAGIYEYLRISLSYQNYTINFRAQNFDLQGTVASFVGANTYIEDYKINNETVSVGENKLQGYWAFETDFPNIDIIEGQAPAGATTVPNPLHNLSPIPPGSCLVTGAFDTPLEITGNETSDIVINCSVSINNSFEWIDENGNGIYEPLDGDLVVDMGVRGLIPTVE